MYIYIHTYIHVHTHISGLFNLSPSKVIWGQVTLCCGDCPEHCRMFSNIPGLCPLGAQSTLPPSTDNEKHPSTLPISPGGGGNPP